MTEGEGIALALLARDKVVLEIGSYCGRSTICMAQTAKRVVAIDWHRGDPSIDDFHVQNDEEATRECTLGEFWHNLEKYGVDEVVVPVVGKLDWITQTLNIDWADLVFIDGSHDKRSTAEALRLAWSCSKRDSVIAVHDWNRIEVREACKEELDWNPEAKVLVDTLYVQRV